MRRRTHPACDVCRRLLPDRRMRATSPRSGAGLSDGAVLAGYLLLSLAFCARGADWRHGLLASSGGDAWSFVWFLNWWPWALSHGQDVLHSAFVYAPNGYDLPWATSVPTAALLSLPVTLTLGANVSFKPVDRAGAGPGRVLRLPAGPPLRRRPGGQPAGRPVLRLLAVRGGTAAGPPEPRPDRSGAAGLPAGGRPRAAARRAEAVHPGARPPAAGGVRPVGGGVRHLLLLRRRCLAAVRAAGAAADAGDPAARRRGGAGGAGAGRGRDVALAAAHGGWRRPHPGLHQPALVLFHQPAQPRRADPADPARRPALRPGVRTVRRQPVGTGRLSRPAAAAHPRPVCPRAPSRPHRARPAAADRGPGGGQPGPVAACRPLEQPAAAAVVDRAAPAAAQGRAAGPLLALCRAGHRRRRHPVAGGGADRTRPQAAPGGPGRRGAGTGAGSRGGPVDADAAAAVLPARPRRGVPGPRCHRAGPALPVGPGRRHPGDAVAVAVQDAVPADRRLSQLRPLSRMPACRSCST